MAKHYMQDGISEIYDGSADLGLFIVSLVVLISVIVSVVMVLYSVLVFFQHDPHTATTTGVATVIDCKKLVTGQYRCRFDVTYMDSKGEGHVVPVEVDRMTEMTEGESVTVNYDPDRPEDAAVGPTPRQRSLMLLGGGVMMFIVAVVSLWLVRRFKILAAAQGAVAVVGMF